MLGELRRNGMLQIEQLRRRLIELIRAVHALGICHRDLHDGDIVLDGDRPLVIDVDLACDVDQHWPCYDVYGPSDLIPVPKAHLEVGARPDLPTGSKDRTDSAQERAKEAKRGAAPYQPTLRRRAPVRIDFRRPSACAFTADVSSSTSLPPSVAMRGHAEAHHPSRSPETCTSNCERVTVFQSLGARGSVP